MENNREIFLILSSTPTRFAKCIRIFGRVRYNHASIGLDDRLSEVYSFARPQQSSVFLGRLVRESLERYTLKRKGPVPIVVFRLSVSEEEYRWVKSTIHRIQNDPEYMYNLFSVLSYPLFRGFSTYKAYSCIEFVTYILKHLNYNISKPYYKYVPDDLLRMFPDKIVYVGDVRGIMSKADFDDVYFKPMTKRMFAANVSAMFKIMGRSVFARGC